MNDNVTIIAEAGVNHNGDIGYAKDLIDVAASAGADYVKFQTFKADRLVTKSAPKASYQKTNLNNSDSQFQMLKKLELTYEMHKELILYADNKNISFLSTAFDIKSLIFLSDIGIKLAKVPSGEITNFPYLKKVTDLFSRVVMSTGMASFNEVKQAFNVLIDNGVSSENINILHCNTEYPTPFEDVNLKAMVHLREQLNVNVGYSDHTMGIEVPIAAVALGATIIEKHFTLDRNLPGPDHAASLEPDELKDMVEAIRNVETAISGSGKKEPSKSEIKNREIVRKSIVASNPIKKGQFFEYENLAIKRPGNGLSPMKINQVIGLKAKRNFEKDELIEI